jgi:hypothetical protein
VLTRIQEEQFFQFATAMLRGMGRKGQIHARFLASTVRHKHPMEMEA